MSADWGEPKTCACGCTDKTGCNQCPAKAQVTGINVPCIQQGNNVNVTCTVAAGNNTGNSATCFAAKYNGNDCKFLGDAPSEGTGWSGLVAKFECSASALANTTYTACSATTGVKKTGLCYVKDIQACVQVGTNQTNQHIL